MLANILQKEAPVLRLQAEPVNPKDFDSIRLKKIITEMKAALEKEEDGVAIAAPQIGVPLRIFIVSHRTFEFKEGAEIDKLGKTIHAHISATSNESTRHDSAKNVTPNGLATLFSYEQGELEKQEVPRGPRHDSAESKVDSKNKQTLTFDMVFINPEITKLSRKKVWLPEGCLSVRWLYGEVLRADKTTISAYDEHGKLFTRGASGLLAQIFQHETDHLNGILFTDTARNIETITREDQERMRREDAQKYE